MSHVFHVVSSGDPSPVSGISSEGISALALIAAALIATSGSRAADTTIPTSLTGNGAAAHAGTCQAHGRAPLARSSL
ncbi:hypothetical protein F6B93_00335 [Mycobacterium spongiae]|uniref:Uncharacterized protein n=1 Tax=Mycobacterium spongiae TaxID=886343 RepID=A0A975PV74_9MYCO|nr:hypothetical protein F6B93_00335 [Mycobacterium spongiae]